MFSELKENISDQWQREEKQNKGGGSADRKVSGIEPWLCLRHK